MAIKSTLKPFALSVFIVEFVTLILVGVLNAERIQEPFSYFVIGHIIGVVIFIIYFPFNSERMKVMAGKLGEEESYTVIHNNELKYQRYRKSGLTKFILSAGLVSIVVISSKLNIPFFVVLTVFMASSSGFLLMFLFIILSMYGYYASLNKG